MIRKYKSIMSVAALIAVVLASVLSVSQVLAKPVSVSLADINYVYGKGVAFVFDVSGHFGQPNLGAVFVIHGNSYSLDCFYNREEGKVVCSSSEIENFAGGEGEIFFNGETFFVTIPRAHAPAPVPSVEPPLD